MCSLQEVSDLEKTFELQDSDITIGRGPFLGVTDKRVSRSHGILKRVENGIELKSIHINPCFYTINSDDKWLKLDKNESIILHPGDTFSLLPKQYIYKVIAKEATTAQKSGPESHKIAENTETDQNLPGNVESKAIVTKVPSNVDPEPLLLAKKSKSEEDDVPKHISQAEAKHATNFNNHNSAKFKIQDATAEFPSDNDAAKFEVQESDEVATAPEKVKNSDKECVKIHPNSSKTPKKEHPKTYVERRYANTYMDGDKEVALPSETKRKLPSWMKVKKSDATTANSPTKKNNIPSKKVEKTKRVTPKRPVIKKRRKVQKIDFDSDETPDELETEPQDVSEDDEKIEADVKGGKMQDDDVTKEVEKDDDVTSNDDITNDLKKDGDLESDLATGTNLSANNQNGNDVTSEDVDMVDASVAAKSMEVDDDVAPSSDNNRSMLPSNPDNAAASRNSCQYGSSCYRKNPTHFVELSHPGDDDYRDQESEEESEKPECPYGTSCYRKNRVHQREYKHTKRVAPKRQTKTKAARKKDNGESSPDDYDLDDSFPNEEEEEEDISDGDSDWNPTNSQSQRATRKSERSRKRKSYHESDSEDETTDEDLNDLVSDAKKFATNRKMWKK